MLSGSAKKSIVINNKKREATVKFFANTRYDTSPLDQRCYERDSTFNRRLARCGGARGVDCARR